MRYDVVVADRPYRAPTVSRAHIISRVGVDILDLHLCPWVTTPFPQQTDYGIDGDVKVTEYGPGMLNPRVLDLTFQYQLKAKDCRLASRPLLDIKVDHLHLWLRMNVPVMLFVALVDVDKIQGDLYWKCVDGSLETELDSALRANPDRKSIRIPFRTGEKFDRGNRGEVVDAIRRRIQALRMPAIEERVQ